MEVTIAKGWWSVAVGLGLMAGLAAMAWIFGDSEAMNAWLEKPLRDASIKDAAVLLIAAAIVAK